MKRSLWLGLALIVSISNAAEDGEFTFHGTLVSPPNCVISNQQTIEVDFGGLVIDDVNGENYMQEVPYTIDCDSTLRSDLMVMTLTLLGNAVDYEDAALATNNSDLGIKVLQNGEPFTINSALTIDDQSKPTLKVVPVKRPGSSLAEGEFESWATLQVDYQ